MMKRLIAVAALVVLLVLVGCAQGQASSASTSSAGSVSAAASASAAASSAATPESATTSSTTAATSTSFLISVGDTQLTVKPANTAAAHDLMEHLQAGPVTVSLHAYGGFEQVGSLPWSLPTSDVQTTTSPGDVMLYQGNQITIFTGSNSWAYTPLGRIEGATSEMLSVLSDADAVEAVLSL